MEDGTGRRAKLSHLRRWPGRAGRARAWSDGGVPGRETTISSFVGFFPAVDPQLVVLVKLDRPIGAYYGGATAAPVTRTTLESILAAQGTPLDRNALALVARAQALPGASRTRPETAQSSGPATASRFALLSAAEDPAPLVRFDSEVGHAADRGPDMPDGSAGVSVPDVTGLPARAAARRMHELGLRVRWEGSGPVTLTLPEAGSRLEPGDTVRLESTGRRGDG